MQGQGSAVKDWRALPLGAYPLSLGNMGQGSVKSWALLGTMQGQGSAAKNWRALPGVYPSILQEQGSAVKIWRALPLGGDPCIFGKNMGALIPTKTP